MATVDLRELRLNRGLGLDAAAEEIGIHRSVLARTENGETTPNPSNAKKLADFYGFSVTDLWPIDSPKAAA